jgi:hypothetical protein
VSIFNRYDEASAVARTKFYFKKEYRESWRLCVFFNVGDVVGIREVDKLLQTVEVFKITLDAKGIWKADGEDYYSSLVQLKLTQ